MHLLVILLRKAFNFFSLFISKQTVTQKNWNEYYNTPRHQKNLRKYITIIIVLVALVAIPKHYYQELLLALGKQENSISIKGSRNNTYQQYTNNSAHEFSISSSREIKTRFSDVYGLESAKKSLNDFLIAMKNPEIFNNIGAKPPKAIILHGPPGTGKTMIARALAGEAGVNIIATTGSSFVQEWVGLGAARVRELFAQARRNKPCIIFIDEFEVLAPDREKMNNSYGNSEYHSTVNQLLSELDGFDENKNNGIYLVAATNYLVNVDKAVVRSGRFHSKILIGYPSNEDKIGILKLHLKKISLDPKIDLDKISYYMDEKFSGADIADVVNEAALEAARRGDKIVGNIHLEHAFKVKFQNPNN